MKARSSQRPLLGAVIPLGGGLAVALSLLGSGCATGPETPAYVTHPLPPPEEVRVQLGAITVVGTDLKATEIAQPMTKGRSAGKGALAGFLIPPVAGGVVGGGYGAAAGLFVSPVTAGAGAIYGAFAGMNKGEYDKITALLQRVVLEGNVPARLESGCVDAIRRVAPQTLLAPSNAPAGTTETTMEIAPLRFGLVAGKGINPPMTLICCVRVRLVRAGDEMELFRGEFNYFGTKHTLRQWAADDGVEFRKGITAACNDLAGQIAERVFLVYAFPGSFAESRLIPWTTER